MIMQIMFNIFMTVLLQMLVAAVSIEFSDYSDASATDSYDLDYIYNFRPMTLDF